MRGGYYFGGGGGLQRTAEHILAIRSRPLLPPRQGETTGDDRRGAREQCATWNTY